MNTIRMQAFTKAKYGGSEVLRLKEVDKPSVKDDHILVKVVANSVNPADYHILQGKPYLVRLASLALFRPKEKILGIDLAGIVEEAGKNVKHFKVGDRVFGETPQGGAFAEYASVSKKTCAVMPKETDFPEMASVPLAGLTAWQAVVTHGDLREGESIFINGSSGGVGHFAVQIAKARKAKVTAVCSSKNSSFVKALGADHVIAYDRESVHHYNKKYNLVIDIHGNLSHNDFRRLGQRGVMVGFTTVGHMVSLILRKAISRFPLIQFTAQASAEDLAELAFLIQEKKINIHLEKVYSFAEVPKAIDYITTMRTKGKVAIVWESVDSTNTGKSKS